MSAGHATDVGTEVDEGEGHVDAAAPSLVVTPSLVLAPSLELAIVVVADDVDSSIPASGDSFGSSPPATHAMLVNESKKAKTALHFTATSNGFLGNVRRLRTHLHR
jgi:hypothetical protein